MSEVWKDSNENQNGQLLDDLDTLFEAASLEYLQDEAQMFDGFYGKAVKNYDDHVLRVVFANWYTKSRIIIEKPLEGAEDAYAKSMFIDEESRVAFSVYILDLLNEDIDMRDTAEVRGDVEYMHLEIYDDGRLALMYFGRPDAEEAARLARLVEESELYKDDEDDTEDEEDDNDEEVVVYAVNPEGALMLGFDCTEHGEDTHAKISELIKTELGIDYWKDRFKASLDCSMDYLTKYCAEDEEK